MMRPARMALILFCLAAVGPGAVPPTGFAAFPAAQEAGAETTGQVVLDGCLPLLLSSDRRERDAGARRFRAGLDNAAAEEVVALLPGLEPAARRAVEGILCVGGPWMPGVVAAARRGKAAAERVEAVLLRALAERPLNREPSRSLSVPDLFPAGVTLAFRERWPGPVPLGELLDRINALAGPERPIILSPDLAGTLAPVRSRPLDGPAPMVVDLLLFERGLGLRPLDTVILVVPGGGGSSELDRDDQEFDSFLLSKIVKTLALPETGQSSAARREAMRALSRLGIPGFFEGAYRAVRAGDGGDRLHAILSGGNAERLVARLAVANDGETTARLIDAWQRAEPGETRRSLTRVLTRLPRDLTRRALSQLTTPSESARVLFDGGEEDAAFARAFRERFRGGAVASDALLLAAHPRLVRSGPVRAAVLETLGAAPDLEGPAAAVADRVLEAAGACLDEGELARLVATASRAPPGLVGAVARHGGAACREALIGALCDGAGGDPLPLIEALEEIEGRDGISPLEAAQGRVERMPGLAATGFLLAFSRTAKRREAAADTLVARLAGGGAEALLATRLLSLAPADRLGALVEPVLREAIESSDAFPAALRDTVLRSAVRTLASDRSAVAGLRIKLRRLFGSALDPLLERGLTTLYWIDKTDSWVVSLRFL